MTQSPLMLLYLTRHGETTANRDGFILGQSDSPLSVDGMATAERLSTVLARCGIRRILTSPLGRAQATAAIIARKIGVGPVLRKELLELSCGLWEGRLRGEVVGEGQRIRSSWTDRPPGGESCKDAEARVSTAIGVLREELTNGPVLVVGHAVVNRVLLKLWYRLAPTFANQLTQPHDHMYVLAGDAPIRWIRADGGTGRGWRR